MILLKYLKSQIITDLKLILLHHQNNLNVGNSSIMSNAAKSFSYSVATCLSVLHNYFDGPTKLFSDMYLAKFSDTSAKSCFPCIGFYYASI